ncbi:MAG: RNA-protein complex protein Nop10 [Thermoprotei archaeon]|nr:MAG: RNA-protein complex protein Nop10 [Thermoprotei archaeon]RLF24550.1 MAG: RNA-protein complex protein Nop10 [Thermoprotei archaeon]
MRWMLRKCVKCGSYTLKDRCPYCGGEVRCPHPAKFSPEDKYGKYRRMLKRLVMREFSQASSASS